MFPILQGFSLHQVVLVGQAPPQVPVGGKPGDTVLPIQVVGLLAHVGKAPAIVGVQDDEVSLDPPVPQLEDGPLHPAEVLRVKAGEVPVVSGEIHLIGEILLGQIRGIHGRALIGEGLGILEIVDVVLGKHAEAHLVEIALVQLLQGFLDHFLGLVRPHVTGGAHRVVGCAVLIGKVVGVCHPHRAVVVARSWRDSEASLGLCLRKRAGGFVGVLSIKGGHKPHLVHPVPVIKTGGGDRLVFAHKGALHGLLHKGIALLRAVYSEFQYVPTFHAHGEFLLLIHSFPAG